MPGTRKVFLSSTGVDLKEWREAAYEAIRLTGATCVRMEDFDADPRPPVKVCEEEVLGADMLVGLLGFHYGSRIPPENARSFTQMEIETARSADPEIPCYLYIAPDNAVNAVAQTGADLDAQLELRKTFMPLVTTARAEQWTNPFRLALRIQKVVFEKMRPEASDREHYEAQLKVNVLEKEAAAAEAPPEDRERLLKEKADVEAKLADLETAYAEAEQTIAGLRKIVDRHGNDLGAEQLARARAALDEKDFDTAQALFAEQETKARARANDARAEAAEMAYAQGEIAEEQVRWGDAAEHYARAARLAPTYDNLLKAGMFLWRAGRSDEAIRFEEDLVALSTREHGETDAKTAKALVNLGASYRVVGRYDDAEPLFRSAIAIDQVTFGKAHPEYAIDLNNLAGLLQETGRHAEAESLFREAMEVTKAALGDAHPDYATRLNNLAGLLQDTGRHAEAEPLLRQALAINQASRGDAHPDHGQMLNNLATLLHAMRRHAEAEPLYHQAIEIGKATIGEAHPNYAIFLNNLAALLRDMGRHVEAEALYRQAIEIGKATIGEAHPNYAQRLNNLALLLQAMGRLGEAETLSRQALATVRNAFGDEHPSTRTVAANRAYLLREHFPDNPALAELEAVFGPEIGR